MSHAEVWGVCVCVCGGGGGGGGGGILSSCLVFFISFLTIRFFCVSLSLI